MDYCLLAAFANCMISHIKLPSGALLEVFSSLRAAEGYFCSNFWKLQVYVDWLSISCGAGKRHGCRLS